MTWIFLAAWPDLALSLTVSWCFALLLDVRAVPSDSLRNFDPGPEHQHYQPKSDQQRSQGVVAVQARAARAAEMIVARTKLESPQITFVRRPRPNGLLNIFPASTKSECGSPIASRIQWPQSTSPQEKLEGQLRSSSPSGRSYPSRGKLPGGAFGRANAASDLE